MYTKKYILCDRYCADRPKRAATITTVATWGKPTEIRFIYPEQLYPQSMAFNPRKKITYNKFYKNKPDIKPQQVERISAQVNVNPQVIQIKKW